MITRLFILNVLALASLVMAGMYPANGAVKMLTAANFKQTLAKDKSAIVAFVAPWCGHCKNLTPHYLKAAESLAPLVPFYAVDCDAQENKGICAEQGIKGFPTIKSFPRGTKTLPHDYQGERTAKAIIDWMSSEVPNRIQVVRGKDQITPFLQKEATLPHALLLTAKPKAPLLWKVLQTEFNKKITFGAAKDLDGALAQSLGISSATGKESWVVVWYPGATQPTVYEGILKYDHLQKYFQSVLSGRREEL